MKQRARVVTDQRIAPVSTVLSWFAAFITAGYMLPWAIAATRGKSNHWATFWVNLLLGWTLIGWIWALVMALNSHQVAGVVVEDDPRWTLRHREDYTLR